MKANRFHIGKVIEEINSGSIDASLMEKAKIRSKGVDQTIKAFYIILRAEKFASLEKIPKRNL